MPTNETYCDSCKECPADTVYMERPLCFPCRVKVARDSWAVDNERDI